MPEGQFPAAGLVNIIRIGEANICRIKYPSACEAGLEAFPSASRRDSYEQCPSPRRSNGLYKAAVQSIEATVEVNGRRRVMPPSFGWIGSTPQTAGAHRAHPPARSPRPTYYAALKETAIAA